MFQPLDLGSYSASNESDLVVLYGAIQDAHVVEFVYSDFQRFVEPYELGKSKLGDILLRGYQIGGGAYGPKVVGWKLFRLDYLASLGISKESFSPRTDYLSLPKFWTYDPIIFLKGG